MSEGTNPTAELEAMQKIAEALSSLDESAVPRVLRWASDAFKPKGDTTIDFELDDENNGDSENRAGYLNFENFHDLYGTADPDTDAEKALVAGYWFQAIRQEQDFDSYKLNKELKDMGYGIPNITQALTALINRKPQFVLQTKKSGSSRQARKRYKLTKSGMDAAKKMLAADEGK